MSANHGSNWHGLVLGMGVGTKVRNRPTAIEDAHRRIQDLESALMVYDVTLFCLVASGQVDELMRGQVRAAAETHQHVMGEPSMLVENRCKKNFLEKSDAASR